MTVGEVGFYSCICTDIHSYLFLVASLLSNHMSMANLPLLPNVYGHRFVILFQNGNDTGFV